jgi:hypothetical protein
MSLFAGFFCITSSLFIIVDGAVETLAGVYAISFLVRMCVTWRSHLSL